MFKQNTSGNFELHFIVYRSLFTFSLPVHAKYFISRLLSQFHFHASFHFLQNSFPFAIHFRKATKKFWLFSMQKYWCDCFHFLAFQCIRLNHEIGVWTYFISFCLCSFRIVFDDSGNKWVNCLSCIRKKRSNNLSF